jgi:hypothetical protein
MSVHRTTYQRSVTGAEIGSYHQAHDSRRRACLRVGHDLPVLSHVRSQRGSRTEAAARGTDVADDHLGRWLAAQRFPPLIQLHRAALKRTLMPLNGMLPTRPDIAARAPNENDVPTPRVPTANWRPGYVRPVTGRPASSSPRGWRAVRRGVDMLTVPGDAEDVADAMWESSRAWAIPDSRRR